jgi:hypothetical protein
MNALPTLKSICRARKNSTYKQCVEWRVGVGRTLGAHVWRACVKYGTNVVHRLGNYADGVARAA